MRGRFHLLVLTVLVLGLGGPLVWMARTQPVAGAMRPVTPGPASFHVASINIAMSGDAAGIAAEVSKIAALRDANVLLLQEVVSETAEGSKMAAELGSMLKKQHVTFASPDGGATRGGLAILSTVPLEDVRTLRLKPQNLVLRTRKRIALAGTIDSPAGRVRIINTHLDTRINPGQRVEQLGPAIDDARAFAGPAVIGGDFNTNDMQWVSNIVPLPFPGWQASRVRALMESRGFRTPFLDRRATFDHLGMQLDWIYMKQLQAESAGIQPLEFSDHHAVWAQLQP